MNRCCLFWHGTRPRSAKLLRIGGCFKSKTDAVTKAVITALGSACSPLPAFDAAPCGQHRGATPTQIPFWARSLENT